jgi:hypothetical protein
MKILDTNGFERQMTDTSLEAMQTAVGGYIEPVRLGDGRIMYVNEEGRLVGLPANEKATQLAGQLIVGNAVILTEEESEND